MLKRVIMGLSRYFPHVVLLTVFLVLNVTLANGWLFYDVHRLVQILLTVVSALLLVASPDLPRVKTSCSTRFRFALSLLVVFSLICSSIGSVYPQIAAQEILNNFGLMVLLYVLIKCRWSIGSENLFVALAAFGTFLYFFQMLVAFGGGIFHGASVEREVIVHHTSNIRFINHIQVLFLPLMIVFSSKAASRELRSLCFFTAVLSVSVLLFLSARAAIGSFFLASIFVYWLRLDKALFVRLFHISILGAVFYLVILRWVPTFFFELDPSPLRLNLASFGRWDMWVEAICLIKQNWLFGVGAMHYGYWSEYGFGHPHNLPIQIMVEYGVPIFLLCAYFALRFLWLMIKLGRAGQLNDFQVACFWAIIAISGVSMFSGVWVAPLTQLTLVVLAAPLLSLCIGADRKAAERNRAVTCGYGKLFLSVRLIFFGFIVSTLWLNWSDVKYRVEGRLVNYDEVQKPLFAPRYWQESYWPKK